MNTLKNADGTLLGPPTYYAFVVVRNTDDFHRVRQWCIDNMKGDPMIRVPHKFPIGISAYDDRAGWTDSMDRAAKYVEVDYFFEHNSDIQWWGYLHQNGNIQVKRWFGDHKDYTEDCQDNEFVVSVVPPFSANSREEAIKIINSRLFK